MGEAVIDRAAEGGGAIRGWANNPFFRFFLICIVLATLINAVAADIHMRQTISTAAMCAKIDDQMWSCDRTGNVFVMCQGFGLVDQPLINMIYYRGNYILWPRHIILPNSASMEFAKQLILNRAIPSDRWLADNSVRTLLVYQQGEVPPNAIIYDWKPSESTPAIAAPQQPEEPGTPAAFFWCGIYTLVLLLCGYAAMCLAIGGQRRRTIEIFGASTVLGSGIVGLGLISLSMLGWVPSRGAILTFGLIGVLIAFIQASRHRLLGFEKSGIKWLGLRPAWCIFPVLAMLYGIGALGYDSLVRHTIMWDAFAIWQLKAKIVLFASLRSHPAYFMDTAFNYSHLRYPVLIPMLSAGVHAVIGHVDEVLDKAPSFLLYLAMAALVFGLIRSWRNTPAAIAATSMLMTLQAMVYLGGTGTGDMAMTALAAGSFVFLLRWIQDQRQGDLIILFFISAASMWAKNEGQAYAAVNVVLLGVFSRRPMQWRSLARVGVFALLLVLCYLPWCNYIRYLPRTDEDYAGRLTISNIIQNLPHVGHVTKGILDQFIDLKLWGAFWLLPVVLMMVRPLSRVTAALWLTIVLHLLIWVVVFIISPLDFDHLLPVTGNRLLMQLAPAVALLIGLQWPTGDMYEKSRLQNNETATLQPISRV